MALNSSLVASKLASFNKNKKGGQKAAPTANSEKIKKYIWKPEPGKTVVRIVPYQFQPDFPFIELKWHYDFNGDKVNYLSPSSLNQPDPIVELASRLEKVRETWAKGRKLQPKLRTYVPIIVRGKENEGVKFWGFGVQVYEQLLAAVNEPDYGDITDLVNGYDIQIDFKTADEVKKDFPETKILIKPKPRPVIDPENPQAKEILELITKKQVNIFDIYTPATYDDLVTALETKLQNEERGVTAGSVPRGAERVAAAAVAQEAAAPTPVVNIEVTTKLPASPSAEQAKKAVPTSDDFAAAFDNLFK